jgi:hypothetical protein
MISLLVHALDTQRPDCKTIETTLISHTSLSLSFPLVLKQSIYLMHGQIAKVITSPTLQTHHTPLIVTHMYLHHQCPDGPCICLAVMKSKLNVPFCSCAVPQKHVALTFTGNQSSESLPGGGTGTVLTTWHTAQHTLGAPLG